MGLGRHPTIGNLSKEHLPAMETVTIPSYGRLDGLRDGLALERHGDHPGDSLISQRAFGIGEQEYRGHPESSTRGSAEDLDITCSSSTIQSNAPDMASAGQP